MLRSLLLGIALLMTGLSHQAGALELGDPAPALAISKFVQGEPLKVGEASDVITVVEFWATWCPPCRESIPHLSELQKQYDGKVRIVGISDEDEQTVRTFVQGQGDNMSYTIALDEGEAASQAYMAAVGVNTIPYSFVVNTDGKLMWHGSPLGGQLDLVLDGLIAGTLDIDQVRRQQKAEPLMQAYQAVAAIDEPELASQIGERILEYSTLDPVILAQLAEFISRSEKLASPDLELAKRAIGKSIELDTTGNPILKVVQAGVLSAEGNKEEAVKLLSEAVESTDDARMKAMIRLQIDELQNPSEADAGM